MGAVGLVVDFEEIERGKGDFAEEDGIGIEVDVAEVGGDPEDADCEEEWEDEANGGILLKAVPFSEGFDHPHGEESAGEGAEKSGEEVWSSGEEEGGNESGEDAVADRISDHGGFADDEICSGEGAGESA